MSESIENNFQNGVAMDEDTIDIKSIFSRLITNWPLFLACVVICLSIAIFYAKIASPDWKVSSKILVEDQKNSPSAAMSGSLNSDIGSVFNVKSSADNEVQILKSRSLMTSVVKQMNLNLRTFVRSGLKNVEIFDDAPFDVKIHYKSDTLLFRKYDIKIVDANNYIISNRDDGVEKKASFGVPIDLKQYSLNLIRKLPLKISEQYAITIEPIDATISSFSSEFNVALSDKQSSTIDLSFTYPHPKKGEAILNTLMKQYLQSNLENKVQIADSTMLFIDKEIATVGKQLSGVETDFERFRQVNNIADIQKQSEVLVTSKSDYYDQLAKQSTQLSIINDMEKQLTTSGNKKALPTGLVIVSADQSFGQLINTYNGLLIERDKASLSFTDNNPTIQNYDLQLNTLRTNILKSLETYRNSLVTSKTQLQKQNENFTGQLKQVPEKQRIYLDFTRQQQLKQELYLYLLQKREETAISKTSTMSSSRIIDSAKSEFLPYKPKKGVIYLVGLILGFIMPGMYLFVIELLNIRIKTKGDIEKLTKISIIGEISHNEEEKSLVVVNNSRSVISEQFRSLRTNLQYATDSSKSNVLLFTSSMSGEGKSFLTLNLGSALALTNKRVIFLELDLRKPKLSENIGVDNSNGFTNYIISKSTDLSGVIKQTWFNENCYLMSSGPIPPNPSELLISEKVGEMIEKLKADFDYIIIDCAPVGLVTDALLLEKYADVTFYVLRQDYTFKSQLNIVNDLRNNKKVKNIYLLVNDIKAKNGGYASYTQGYGYGYGYGDYVQETKKTRRSWFKSK